MTYTPAQPPITQPNLRATKNKRSSLGSQILFHLPFLYISLKLECFTLNIGYHPIFDIFPTLHLLAPPIADTARNVNCSSFLPLSDDKDIVDSLFPVSYTDGGLRRVSSPCFSINISF